MSISFEHALDVFKSPDRVFAVLNDESMTPQWLAPARQVEKVTPGPAGPGTILRCAYQFAGRQGSIDGQIVRHVPNQRLTLSYVDERVEVVADFRMHATGQGTWLIHTVEVIPKSFLAQMAAPLIRSQLPDQAIQTLNALRSLIETINEETETRLNQE